jgi:hypothetical protein
MQVLGMDTTINLSHSRINPPCLSLFGIRDSLEQDKMATAVGGSPPAWSRDGFEPSTADFLFATALPLSYRPRRFTNLHLAALCFHPTIA